MHGRTVAPENPEIRDLLFVARVALPARSAHGFESVTWRARANGLSYVLVGGVPRSDLQDLRRRFDSAANHGAHFGMVDAPAESRARR